MQYTTLLISALAANAVAQDSTSTPDLISVLSVLQTAVPSSILAAGAAGNSAAAISAISSEFYSGARPSWFTALPTDIQSYLNPANPAVAFSIASQAEASATAAQSVIPPANGTVVGGVSGNATLVGGGGATMSMSSTSGGMSSGTGDVSSMGTSTGAGSASSTAGGAAGASGSSGSGSGSSSSSSEAGAAMPTALYGMGLAGAVGLVGIFAL